MFLLTSGLRKPLESSKSIFFLELWRVIRKKALVAEFVSKLMREKKMFDFEIEKKKIFKKSRLIIRKRI